MKVFDYFLPQGLRGRKTAAEVFPHGVRSSNTLGGSKRPAAVLAASRTSERFVFGVRIGWFNQQNQETTYPMNAMKPWVLALMLGANHGLLAQPRFEKIWNSLATAKMNLI